VRIYKATEVAQRLKISKQTLLRYEKKGIFPVSRRNRINGWREYVEEDVKKMERILGRAFTLIELTMVMVVMSILIVMAVPRFQSFYFIKLNCAVKKAVQDIRYAQQLAIDRHETYKIIFDPSANSYDVRLASDNSLATDPFSRQDLVRHFDTDPQYHGIDLVSASFAGSPVLQFDWQGTPLDAGGNALAAAGQVRFGYQGTALEVDVAPGTGWVRVQ
jgi:prepilin-type N-terminal cleavage/methylation domain-containing protein